MTSSLGPVLERIFKSLYEAGAHTLIFDIEMFEIEAQRLGNFISARTLNLTYVGIDRHGCQFIIPVQAKGGNDQLSTVQAKQDIACCAEKFPNLVCRAISAQFMDDSRIAMFELCLDDDGLVKTIEERHYLLVQADQIGTADLERYRTASR